MSEVWVVLEAGACQGSGVGIIHGVYTTLEDATGRYDQLIPTYKYGPDNLSVEEVQLEDRDGTSRTVRDYWTEKIAERQQHE